MQSYMEMIAIDSDDQARHTNVGAAMDSNKATWAAFQSYRHLDVGADCAQFLLDYHNAKGNLADTIRLDATGFKTITGEEPKAEADYRKIDEDYWAQTIAESKARRAEKTNRRAREER